MAMTFAKPDQIDPALAWQPWQPTADDPWGRKWAAHLYRRAGFGPSREDLARGRAPRLRGHARPAAPRAARCRGGRGDPRRTSAASPPERDDSGDQLRGWWLYRMLQGGHPLREKMTLFWHDHFATSLAKVLDPALMFRQNGLLRAARPRAVRPVPASHEQGPGHARLARLQHQRQGPAERELRPRADGAVQPGRRPLHRDRTSARPPAPSPAGAPTARASCSTPACTTAGPRRSWDRPAPGTAATWCASCWSSRRRRGSWSASSTASSSARWPLRPTRCSSRSASRSARATTTSPRWSGPSWPRGTSTRVTPSGRRSRDRWSTCWGRCRRCIADTTKRKRTTGRCRSKRWWDRLMRWVSRCSRRPT